MTFAYQNSPSSATERHISRSWALTVFHRDDLQDSERGNRLCDCQCFSALRGRSQRISCGFCEYSACVIFFGGKANVLNCLWGKTWQWITSLAKPVKNLLQEDYKKTGLSYTFSKWPLCYYPWKCAVNTTKEITFKKAKNTWGLADLLASAESRYEQWWNALLRNVCLHVLSLSGSPSHRSLQSPCHSPLPQGFHKRTRFTSFP